MIERDFKHLIDEIAILIQFVEGSLEQFNLHIEVHPNRPVEADETGVNHSLSVSRRFIGLAIVTLLLYGALGVPYVLIKGDWRGAASIAQAASAPSRYPIRHAPGRRNCRG
jgi:hypothetical protein